MINPFIKLTGCGKNEVLHVQIVNINGIVLVNGFTEVSLNGCAYIVKETPEEISAMIQEYYDEKMRLDFIHSALTGMCSDSDEFPTWDSVSRSAINIGDMVMENLKND